MSMAQVTQEDRLNIGAKKFNMWIFIFTSFMFFAALTSGFIVYSGGHGHGLDVIMPRAFMYSTIVIVLSSVSLFMASRMAKQSEIGLQRLFLWITFGLGIIFFASQIQGCSALINEGVYFVNPNASRSFVYVFVVAHLVHIIAALIVLLNAIIGTYRSIGQVKNLYKMDLTSIFWHFLDIIWIYLYVFLLLNQN
jgi:cytochrome c oxidase subunit III